MFNQQAFSNFVPLEGVKVVNHGLLFSIMLVHEFFEIEPLPHEPQEVKPGMKGMVYTTLVN